MEKAGGGLTRARSNALFVGQKPPFPAAQSSWFWKNHTRNEDQPALSRGLAVNLFLMKWIDSCELLPNEQHGTCHSVCDRPTASYECSHGSSRQSAARIWRDSFHERQSEVEQVAGA
jgi:hypothetical protein